jgi:hypothetical protein
LHLIILSLVNFCGVGHSTLELLSLGPFLLASWFTFLVGFYYPIDDIKILGIPFGSNSFFLSFLQKVLDENVRHANALPKLGDVQVAFGILS